MNEVKFSMNMNEHRLASSLIPNDQRRLGCRCAPITRPSDIYPRTIRASGRVIAGRFRAEFMRFAGPHLLGLDDDRFIIVRAEVYPAPGRASIIMKLLLFVCVAQYWLA